MEQRVKTDEHNHANYLLALKKEVKGDMRQSVLLLLIEKLENKLKKETSDGTA
jgi:hypothetical protein